MAADSLARFLHGWTLARFLQHARVPYYVKKRHCTNVQHFRLQLEILPDKKCPHDTNVVVVSNVKRWTSRNRDINVVVHDINVVVCAKRCT
jgi:hypothetical protein